MSYDDSGDLIYECGLIYQPNIRIVMVNQELENHVMDLTRPAGRPQRKRTGTEKV
jgi:hypothetical protein